MSTNTGRTASGAAAALALLGARGSMSRTMIARELGISPATVTQIIKGLVERGLVVELESVPSGGGRPSRMLGLRKPAAVRAIGAKVTAAHVAIVSVGLDGVEHVQSARPFDPFRPDSLDTLGRILRDAVDAEDGLVLGVGVGIPGSVDDQASGVVTAPTLGWISVPVGDSLRRALGVPVLVENDVNTLATAEHLYGVGGGHSSFLVLTIGRGIGAGLVVDGGIRRGATGGAGEIGHVPVVDDGPLCECGNHGCLESLIGEAALRDRAIAAGILGADGTVADLLALADCGDTSAQELYAAAGRTLGRTLAGVVHVVDPELVVLLGEGTPAWPHWRVGFEAAFRGHLLPSRRAIPFEVESWDEGRWALGAAALVLAAPFGSGDRSGEQGRQIMARMQNEAGSAPTTGRTR
ncbi:ROK family protein [Brachybacterium vulturis]|uniref:ROK family protein n=1 Tax=Brachybacterium vulturis TaxID=2017484 RepID=UPI003734C4D0